MNNLNFIGILILIVTHCSNYVSVSSLCLKDDDTVNWHRSFYVDNKTLSITIDVTTRKSHRIVSHILKILLVEKLKYEKVHLNTIPWYSPAETLRRLYEKKSPKLPGAHINLEVWHPPGFNMEALVNDNLVLDCGPLGPIARRGIFALTDTMNDLFTATNKSLDHWRTFGNPPRTWNYTTLYNWLTHKKKWKPLQSYSSADIGNVPIILIDRQEFQKPLKRLFEKVYSKAFFRIILMHDITGNLKQTIEDWIKYAKNISHPQGSSPIFFYDWYPSTVTVNRSYSRVLFPDCYGIEGDPLCDFEVNQLSKVVWVNLKAHASMAYQLVNQFKISQSEWVNLLNKVGEKWNDDQFSDLACDWVKTKKHLWVPWTNGWDKKQKLVIAGLFSLYGKWFPEGLVNASHIELKKQNELFFNASSYELVLDIRNLTCVEDIVLKEYLNISATESNSSITLAYLAAICSDSLESTLKVSTFQQHIVVTSTADSPKFGNISQYKYFYRTLPSMNLQLSFFLHTFRILKWKRIVILRKDSMFYESKVFEQNNITVIEDFEVEENRLTYDGVYHFLKRMRDQKKGRIFLVEYFAESTRIIMCAAYKLNMTLNRGFVWFLNSWMKESWNNVSTKNCTAAEIVNITSKHLLLVHRDAKKYVYGLDTDFTIKPGHNTELGRQLFKEYTANAIRKIAHATNKLLIENPSALSVLKSPKFAEKFVNYISNFDPNPNIPRQLDVVEGAWILLAISQSWKIPLLQWDVESDYAFNTSNQNTNSPTIRLIREFWGKNNKYTHPSDGEITEEASTCIIEGVRRFLGTTCSVAIIIFNISIIVPITLIIICCFIFFFRRLQKTQEEEGIRKPFEFLCDELSGLDLPGKDVVINRTVGKGNFGIVYGGEARQNNKWVLVAIKAISKKLDIRHKYEFLSEAKLMSYLNHENIVKLIGICLNPDNDMIYLIMEHVTGGDLKKFLIKRRVKAKEDPKNDIICPERLTKYARDIASGLSYLHQNRYLHRDVACRNCLISADYSIKVGDFGLARKMVKFSRKGDNGYYRFSGLGAMPIRWLPPESLQFGIYSVATDIWSYGVTLYEIVTFGVFPFGGYEHEEVVDKVKRCRFTVANFLPDSFKSTKVYEIISKCCSYNPTERFRSMEEIIDELDNNAECVQSSLTDDPPNIQNISFSNAVVSESNVFLPRKISSKTSRHNIDATVPSYVYSNSEPSTKDIDIHMRADDEFLRAFTSFNPNLESSPTLSLEQPLNAKSQSTEFIHLTDLRPDNVRTEISQNNDTESSLGYVSYKTGDTYNSIDTSQTTTEPRRPNYLKMSTKTMDEISFANNSPSSHLDIDAEKQSSPVATVSFSTSVV